MRIIDNKYDFYDYLQDPTDQLVFDRRESYNLTKELLCSKIKPYSHYWVSPTKNNYRILIQCGAAFWLVLLKMNDTMDNYDLELLDFWKNYDKPNELLKIDLIVFGWRINRAKVEDMRDAVNHNDYLKDYNINRYTKYTDYKTTYKKEEYTIPILSPSGLGNIIDPMDMFCAIEEYFSIEKTKLETTEPKGVTNDDKIVMHGFDTKSSFRGKNEDKKWY